VKRGMRCAKNKARATVKQNGIRESSAWTNNRLVSMSALFGPLQDISAYLEIK
jgi:hypothetical protein